MRLRWKVPMAKSVVSDLKVRELVTAFDYGPKEPFGYGWQTLRKRLP